MINYNRPVGIDSLLQDLYTPAGYNPAEYTLLGYDPGAGVLGMPGGVPMPGGAPMVAAGQGNAGYNQTIEDIAAQNKAEYIANNPEAVFTPDQGITAMPKEQQVGFGGYDAEGLMYDEKGRAYDVLGRMVRDEYGRGAVGLTAQQAGITPEMAARGYTMADVWGP